MLRPKDDLLQLGELSAGSASLMQPGYFPPPGVTGPAAAVPPAGVMSPTIPLQGGTFRSMVPQVQPYPGAVPAAQQPIPPAMLHSGSYPAAAAASLVGSYPVGASGQAVPRPMSSANTTAAAATTTAGTSQTSVSHTMCSVFCLTSLLFSQRSRQFRPDPPKIFGNGSVQDCLQAGCPSWTKRTVH